MAVSTGTTKPGRSSQTSNSDVESLAANLRQAELLRDKTDLGEQLAANWKNIIIGVFLVMFLSYIFQLVRSGRETARGGISQKFEGMQHDFTALFFEPADGTDVSHIQRAFDEKLRAMGDADRRSAYAQLTEIYRAAAEFRRGEIGKARESLQPFNIEMLEKGGKITKEELMTEIALLVKAKVLVSDSSTKNEGQALLRDLCTKSLIVSGEALLAYNRIFGLDQGLVDTTLQSHPALRESLKGPLLALGAKT